MRTVAWLGLAWALTVSTAAAASVKPAHQCDLYALHSVARPFNENVLTHDVIKGMALQIGWREVEPADNDYQWRQIDEVVAAARARGKQVVLHVLPLRPPQWLFDAGAEPFEFTVSNRKNPKFGKTRKEVVPWDPVYLQQWQALVTQLGARYAGQDAVFGISVTAPSPEMVLPGGIPRNPAYSRMAAMYDEEKYAAAWRHMIDVYQAAFPAEAKFLAPGIVLRDEFFADQVLDYAYQKFGNRLWAFNAGLHAGGTAVGRMGKGYIEALLREYAVKANLGFQMIWSASNDPHQRMRGALPDAIAQGARLGAGYMEIYEIDLRDPALAEAIAGAAQRYCGYAPVKPPVAEPEAVSPSVPAR